MDYIDYRKKIGIGFNDKEKETYFRHCILNHLYSIEENNDTEYHDDDLFDFCCNVGIEKLEVRYYESVLFTAFNILRETKSLTDFLSYYIFFVQSIPSENDVKDNLAGKKVYYNLLREMLNKAHIPFEIYEDKDGMFFFPRGAKELDDALVSEPLEWMRDYPNSRKTYCRALKQFTDKGSARDCADNFRKALEDFLREFLNNKKDLKSNKKEVESFLKDNHANGNLIAMLTSLISHYYLMNNDTAKHKDDIDHQYLEYIMYQTGVVIRMLMIVKLSSKGESL